MVTEIESVVEEILQGDITKIEKKIGKYHYTIYKVKGKGKGGKDCVRIDITKTEEDEL